MPARCEAKNRIVAYTAGGLVRRKLDAGNRDTNSGKNEERRRKSSVGAWCRIGGGQGALSQAHKETGVACKPSKPLDYSNAARESIVEAHVKVAESQDGSGLHWRRRKSGKVRLDRGYQKERSEMDQLDGCGSLALVVGSQGILIRPTKATTKVCG